MADAATWIKQSLRFSKGRWFGQPFVLEPWQYEIVSDLFHTYDDNGLRQYRTAYVSLPRKNGKTEMMAAVALYWLFVAGEPGSEIYSVAGDADQASIAFEAAKRMVEQNGRMADACKIYRRSIVRPDTGAHYRVLSSESAGKHGYSPDLVIFDELHVQKDRDLWDVMRTGMGARQQPLLAAITTAGVYDPSSVAWEVYSYAKGVLAGTIDDPTFYAKIWEADKSADWTDPAVWRAANPNLGVSISEQFLEQECAAAKEQPAFQNTFRRLYLNCWTEQLEKWIDMARWEKCGGTLDVESLRGKRCYGGLDLASTQDITAFVLYFPDERAVLCWFWVPDATVDTRTRKDQVQYRAWSQQGHIEVTPGDVADYRYIIERIVSVSRDYDLREVWYDPWNAEQAAVELADMHGVRTVRCPQGMAHLNGPSKAFERLYWSGELRHGDNPVLNWMASNATKKEDSSGNIRPDKGSATEKIDGIVALIMAIGAADKDNAPSSVYEEREPMVLNW